MKKQTREQLEEFKRQQEKAEKAAKTQDAPSAAVEGTETWAVGSRKRKKGQEREVIPGLKLKKASTGNSNEDSTPKTKAASQAEKETPETESKPDASSLKSVDEDKNQQSTSNPTKSASPPSAALGLGAYSSDEDD